MRVGGGVHRGQRGGEGAVVVLERVETEGAEGHRSAVVVGNGDDVLDVPGLLGGPERRVQHLGVRDEHLRVTHVEDGCQLFRRVERVAGSELGAAQRHGQADGGAVHVVGREQRHRGLFRHPELAQRGRHSARGGPVLAKRALLARAPVQDRHLVCLEGFPLACYELCYWLVRSFCNRREWTAHNI
mmetsp:Transcript_29723/g.44852  ORF Transcript_29723/g.44852 Transcript_29723/m.44852 type:complete len:186 (+) Transcript_29723:1357-1914(+)